MFSDSLVLIPIYIGHFPRKIFCKIIYLMYVFRSSIISAAAYFHPVVCECSRICNKIKMDGELEVSDVQNTPHSKYCNNAIYHHICSQFCSLFRKRVCSEIGFRVKKRRQIATEYDICNLDDLLQLKFRLENGELRSMAEEIRQKLLLAAVWRRRNPEVNVMEDFDEDVWEDWVKSCKDAEVNVSLLSEDSDDRIVADINVTLLSEDDGDRMDAEMNVSLSSVL